MPLELLEQRRDHQVPRLRPGAVAHGDGDGLPGSDALAQRRADVGAPQRPGQRGPLVGHGLELAGPDDGRGSVGDVDHHPRLAVGEVDLHAGRLAGSVAAPVAESVHVGWPCRRGRRRGRRSAARPAAPRRRRRRRRRRRPACTRASRCRTASAAGRSRPGRARRRAGGRRPTSSTSRPRLPGPRACTTRSAGGPAGRARWPTARSTPSDGGLGGVVDHEPAFRHLAGQGRRGREVVRPDQQVVGEAACGHRAQPAHHVATSWPG